MQLWLLEADNQRKIMNKKKLHRDKYNHQIKNLTAADMGRLKRQKLMINTNVY